MSTETPIRPAFHHFNLKTTRLQELIDWYATVVGAEVTFQDATGAWLTNDPANHRIALLCFPGFVDDPDRETRTGMHHSAFGYPSFADLNGARHALRRGPQARGCPVRQLRRCRRARARPAAILGQSPSRYL